MQSATRSQVLYQSVVEAEKFARKGFIQEFYQLVIRNCVSGLGLVREFFKLLELVNKGNSEEVVSGNQKTNNSARHPRARIRGSRMVIQLIKPNKIKGRVSVQFGIIQLLYSSELLAKLAIA